MLTSAIMSDLKKIQKSQMPNQFGEGRAICHHTVRGALEHGQKLFRFDRTRSALDVFIFCGFTSGAEDTKQVIGCLNRGESLHTSNVFTDNTLIRDILLSNCPEYATECYFVSEELATRALRIYKKKQAQKVLQELEDA